MKNLVKTLIGPCALAVLLLAACSARPQQTKEKYPLSDIQTKTIQNQVLRLMLAQDKVNAAEAEFNTINAQVLAEMKAAEKANHWPDNLLLQTEDPVTHKPMLPDTIKMVDPPTPPAAPKAEAKKP